MVTVVEEDKLTNSFNERVDLVLEENSMLDATMFDQIPEFIREEIDEDRRRPQLDAKPMLPQASIEVLNRNNEVSTIPLVSVRSDRTISGDVHETSPPADELEALWPGVHHELIQPTKRQPSFYLMLGFMAGAVVSLLGVWSYSAVASRVVASNDHSSKSIVVAGATATTRPQQPADPTIEVKSVDPNATLVPISSTYEVKTGDTLVMIAMKNYKKVTPRLLDEIVKANGMKSANVLSLGQKITLPQYTPSSAIAASSSGQVR